MFEAEYRKPCNTNGTSSEQASMAREDQAEEPGWVHVDVVAMDVLVAHTQGEDLPYRVVNLESSNLMSPAATSRTSSSSWWTETVYAYGVIPYSSRSEVGTHYTTLNKCEPHDDRGSAILNGYQRDEQGQWVSTGQRRTNPFANQAWLNLNATRQSQSSLLEQSQATPYLQAPVSEIHLQRRQEVGSPGTTERSAAPLGSKMSVTMP